MADVNGKGHAVEKVEIDADSHVAVCTCGWRSAVKPSETEARIDHDAHAARAG